MVLAALFFFAPNLSHAQEDASIDSSLLAPAPLNPLPIAPIGPEPAIAMRPHANLKLFVALGAGTYAAAAVDMRETMARRKDNPLFRENDPLARPFTRLPAPAYYATGFALVTGLNWLSLRMARSERWHRVWWLPQACAIGGNLFGFAYSKHWE